jgi:hypothetical protein
MQLLSDERITIEAEVSGDRAIYRLIGFGMSPASNSEIVPIVDQALFSIPESLMLIGKIACVTGRVSVPVVTAIAHRLAHVHPAVAIFDPKLPGFVVTISHHSKYQVGDIIQPR